MCFHSLVYIPWIGIAASYGTQNSRTIFHSYQQCTEILISPHPHPFDSSHSRGYEMLSHLLNTLLRSTELCVKPVLGARDEQWTGQRWPCPHGGPRPTIDLDIQGVMNTLTRQVQEVQRWLEAEYGWQGKGSGGGAASSRGSGETAPLGRWHLWWDVTGKKGPSYSALEDKVLSTGNSRGKGPETWWVVSSRDSRRTVWWELSEQRRGEEVTGAVQEDRSCLWRLPWRAWI